MEKMTIIPGSFADKMLFHYRCFGHFEPVETPLQLVKMAVLLPFYALSHPFYAGRFRTPPAWLLLGSIICAELDTYKVLSMEYCVAAMAIFSVATLIFREYMNNWDGWRN